MNKLEAIIDLLEECLETGWSPIDVLTVTSFLEEQQQEIESLKFEISQKEDKDFDNWLKKNGK